MTKFRKKPVVIEAVRWTGKNFPEVSALGGEIKEFGDWNNLEISTLEGRMFAHVGDWIIKGVNGEVYPCKPDIFDKTYDQVPENFQDAVRDEPITPMSDEEIAKVETNPNCPECGGDGGDLEDSSKDCWGCGGDGTMSSFRRRNPIRTKLT